MPAVQVELASIYLSSVINDSLLRRPQKNSNIWCSFNKRGNKVIWRAAVHCQSQQVRSGGDVKAKDANTLHWISLDFIGFYSIPRYRTVCHADYQRHMDNVHCVPAATELHTAKHTHRTTPARTNTRTSTSTLYFIVFHCQYNYAFEMLLLFASERFNRSSRLATAANLARHLKPGKAFETARYFRPARKVALC